MLGATDQGGREMAYLHKVSGANCVPLSLGNFSYLQLLPKWSVVFWR